MPCTALGAVRVACRHHRPPHCTHADHPTTRPQVEKAEKREETVAVAVVAVVPRGAPASGAAAQAASRFLLVQRPSSGLLAGLWQFPLLQLAGEAEEAPLQQQQLMDQHLEAVLGVRLAPQGVAAGPAGACRAGLQADAWLRLRLGVLQ